MIQSHLNLKLKSEQRLMLSSAMQQALHVLQLPITDVASWLQLQIEQNPLLQFDEPPAVDELTELDFEAQGFEVLDLLDETFIQGAFPEEPVETPPLESCTEASISLYDHLMQQASIAFHSPAELHHAEQIIGHLNRRGFLEDFEADPAILSHIQAFDPPGIAARNLQECLLIQLRMQADGDDLATQLIAHHFDDLLQGRMRHIAKKLHISLRALELVIQKKIAPLDFHPGAKFHQTPSSTMVPDLFIEKRENEWEIKVNEEPLPRFLLSPPLPELSHHYNAGKWTQHILEKRREILQKIADYLLHKHPAFFTGSTMKLEPSTMQEMAWALQLHESTITRAVKDKYLSCPQGIYPLRYFFPHICTATQGEKATSHIDAKQYLQQLIHAENKAHPLSDAKLATVMKQAGIPCARRTIAKYRHLLRIPSAFYRKREN